MIFDDKEVGEYTSDDAYEDLESIRALLHDAQRRIYRHKLEEADICVSIVVNSDGIK